MISVIIPALNEEKALPGTLEALARQSGEFETIVVDGGSDDRTESIARTHVQARFLTAPKGRARQLNAGAAAARGEILLFLHADTKLPDDAIPMLNALEKQYGQAFGGFRQRFSGDRRSLRLVSWLHNLRCRLTGVFYGDQAMFVSAELFDRVGGFPDSAILEDVMISEMLRAHVRPRLLDTCVTTDARKFETLGPWRALAYCVVILICYELRLPIAGRRFFAAVR